MKKIDPLDKPEVANEAKCERAVLVRHGGVPRRSGVRFLAGLVALCLGSAGSGALSMRFLRAPQVQAMAITVTVPVQQGILTQSVVSRGQISYAATANVTYRGNSAGFVTDIAVSVGQTVEEGDRLFDVSGRPVIVLQGQVPMYRDLMLGDLGSDVEQLNGALVRLGVLRRGGDTMTSATSTALDKLYRQLGYASPPAPAASQQVVSTQEATVAAAQTQLAQAQAQVTQSSVLTAQLAVAQAQAALDADPTSAEAALSLALAKQQLAEALNPPAVAAAQAALSAAQRALSLAKAAAVTPVPLSEVVFIPVMPAHVISLSALVGVSPDGTILQLGSGTLSAQVRLSAAQRALVTCGQPVSVEPDGSTVSIHGHVISVGSTLMTAFDGAQGYVAQVELDDGDLSTAGQQGKATITVSQSDGSVFFVPQSAVHSDTGGRTYVYLCRDADTCSLIERVDVVVGIISSGSVQVESGSLHVNDRVVVDQTGG